MMEVLSFIFESMVTVVAGTFGCGLLMSIIGLIYGLLSGLFSSEEGE
jgi:hypothetical protein